MFNVYALTFRKDENAIYNQFFKEVIHLSVVETLFLQPTTIIIDFELAAMNAARINCLHYRVRESLI